MFINLRKASLTLASFIFKRYWNLNSIQIFCFIVYFDSKELSSYLYLLTPGLDHANFIKIKSNGKIAPYWFVCSLVSIEFFVCYAILALFIVTFIFSMMCFKRHINSFVTASTILITATMIIIVNWLIWERPFPEGSYDNYFCWRPWVYNYLVGVLCAIFKINVQLLLFISKDDRGKFQTLFWKIWNLKLANFVKSLTPAIFLCMFSHLHRTYFPTELIRNHKATFTRHYSILLFLPVVLNFSKGYHFLDCKLYRLLDKHRFFMYSLH